MQIDIANDLNRYFYPMTAFATLSFGPLSHDVQQIFG